jgi:hypothetical protein
MNDARTPSSTRSTRHATKPLLLALAGGAVGFFAGFPWDEHPRLALWASVLAGLLIGGLVLPAFRWFRAAGEELGIEEFPVSLPFVGDVVFNLSDVHRRVGWRIFVEAVTRVATRGLRPGEGIIREALESLHALFDVVRTELKEVRPSPPPQRQREYTVESYAIRMLNDALRPCLSRWHPMLLAWEQAGLSEETWPLADLCRADLDVTWRHVAGYCRGLGVAVRVAGLDDLLPPLADEPKELAAEADVARQTESARLTIDAAREKQRVFTP